MKSKSFFLIIFIFLFIDSESQNLSKNLNGAIAISSEDYSALPKFKRSNSLAFTSSENSSTKSSYSLEIYVPPVKKQVGGTCTGFSIIYYALSTQYNAAFEIVDNIDKIGHSFDPYFAYALLESENFNKNEPCDHGNYILDVISLVSDKGAKKRFFPPFITCKTNLNNYTLQNAESYISPYALRSYYSLDMDSYELISDVKENIFRKKPVSFGIYLTDKFDYVGSGGYTDSSYLKEYNYGYYHAMTIVGFDNSKNSFRVVNSWGKNWGDKGFFWLKYDDFKRFVREAYVMNLSGLKLGKNPELKIGNYERFKLLESETYEGEAYESEPSGIGVYSFLYNGNRVNVVGKMDSVEKNGNYIYIDNEGVLSIRYKNDIIQNTQNILGFVSDDDEKEIINQEMFNQYWTQYGDDDKPVKIKGVIIKLNSLFKDENK